jgi:diketogulonate reductase-like aldo/keto reductase
MTRLLNGLILASSLAAVVGDISISVLSNEVEFPLVGIGVGNLQHELIEEVISSSLQPGIDIRLIDTAHASNNEGIIANAIVKADTELRRGRKTSFKKSDPPPIHVVTKVWYTHLGYERTKISVKETLKELGAVNTRQIYVHMLLHWPRCNDDIEWMNCAQEEENLPQSVKDAGAPPHLNKDTAWKDSWRALEEIYEDHSSKRKGKNKMFEPIVASIGVSNFEIDDMRALKDIAKVQPHLYQGDVWKAFYDPVLLRYIRDNNIFFQAYGVMNRIIGGRERAPRAFSILEDIAREIASTLHASGEYNDKPLVVTEGTVLLAYCVYYGIGVIPRASSAEHRRENSPDVIAAVRPHLTAERFNRVSTSLID